MNTRKHARFAISLHATVIINGKSYQGIIGNVSEEGMSSTLTTFINTDDAFLPQKEIELHFELPSGRQISMTCDIRWYLRPSHNKSSLILGLYILEPPEAYREWMKHFSNKVKN